MFSVCNSLGVPVARDGAEEAVGSPQCQLGCSLVVGAWALDTTL